MSPRIARLFAPAFMLLAFAGCRSPYYADQGALLGGLGGAGVGAIVGNAVGHTGAGALIGAGAGALGGAVVGNALDDVEARNRAQIAQQMTAVNMQAPVGAVRADDVVQMTQAGVAPELIVNHIRANGVASPLQSGDVIFLSRNNVHPDVIAALQNPPIRTAAAPLAVGPPTVVAPGPMYVEHVAPGPVIVEEHFYGPPRYFHHHHHHRHRHHPPHGVSWGVSVAH
ncbi:MAG: glycine zipper domain-containing protein [Pirellulales bacterium]